MAGFTPRLSWGTHLEWLDDSAPAASIAPVMAAMANSQGGMVIVGVAETLPSNKETSSKPHVTGVSDKTYTIDRILEATLSLDPPLIIPLPNVEKIDSKPIVVAHIPAGMPHIYAIDGRYLQRQGVENAALKPPDLRRLLIQRGGISFETEIAQNATLDDLDWDKVEAYISGLSGIGETQPEKILLNRGCLVKKRETLYPTNAGILLFGVNPQRILRGGDITAVRFAGQTMSDTFNRQDITGTLPDQIHRAETFLVDHLRKGVTLRHTMTRDESFEYPLEAARELVVNAVAHRDYSIQGDGIRLFIFQDRMEVASPGGLPGPVTIQNIKDERFSRNPAIVQVLSDMGFIERLGYGVDRVIELMKRNHLQEPEFKETGGGFRVVLYNQSTVNSSDQANSEALLSKNVIAKYADIPINARQEAALVYLKDGATRITNSELQRLFPDVHAETIRRDLADLVTKDILQKMGQKRGSYYVLKRNVEQPETE
jgi:ATP-dependent DNA helicase RecG